ncbi:MAG: AfsR family transcriptional regulator, partial [Umezawaea sp.]
VLQGFLSALGVRHDTIPASLETRAALFRSILTGRKVLVVLDNARDTDQVRPLLPGTGGNAVLVTSRGRLAELGTVNGARLSSLDILPVPDAREFLVARIGRGRVLVEPAILDEIIERCGRLPLALAIVAARAAIEGDRSLTVIAADLRRGHGTLDPFSDEELDRDLRAVFTWSYRLLSAGAARLLRLLPSHPGVDVTVDSAASLAGVPGAEAREQMIELIRTRLINRHRPNRYQLHDLVRAYARELCAQHETSDHQRAARRRVQDHYLWSARAASLLIRPQYDPVQLARPPTPESPLDPRSM